MEEEIIGSEDYEDTVANQRLTLDLKWLSFYCSVTSEREFVTHRIYITL